MPARTIVCPACNTSNRVPLERPAEKARCGACKAALFQGRPVEVDTAAFERQARGELPLLVDVWAPWCGPCRMMAPQFERAAAELEPSVRLLKLNSDEAPELSSRFAIRSIPTLLLLQGGRVVARTSGAMDSRSIVEWTRANLPLAA